jgi:hypothetical protein
MTPEEFLRLRDEQAMNIYAARLKILEARRLANECELPCNLRAATPRDVVVDAVLWYPHLEPKWFIVDEVLYPNDAFKAFIADDGCRYGLNGAFVEVGRYSPPSAAEEER